MLTGTISVTVRQLAELLYDVSSKRTEVMKHCDVGLACCESVAEVFSLGGSSILYRASPGQSPIH